MAIKMVGYPDFESMQSALESELREACAKYIDAFERYERERRETGGEPSELAARAIMEADDEFYSVALRYEDKVHEYRRASVVVKTELRALYKERVREAADEEEDEERERMVQAICDGFARDRKLVEADVSEGVSPNVSIRRPMA